MEILEVEDPLEILDIYCVAALLKGADGRHGNQWHREPERLLVIAAPRSQARRLKVHLEAQGTSVNIRDI